MYCATSTMVNPYSRQDVAPLNATSHDVELAPSQRRGPRYAGRQAASPNSSRRPALGQRLQLGLTRQHGNRPILLTVIFLISCANPGPTARPIKDLSVLADRWVLTVVPERRRWTDCLPLRAMRPRVPLLLVRLSATCTEHCRSVPRRVDFV
jgi:hypothetical protein